MTSGFNRSEAVCARYIRKSSAPQTIAITSKETFR
jgi:hypothetical protein